MIRKEIEKLGIPELEEISIDTVERYQGSQRDIILYSFTIQSRYQLDFLTANTSYEDGQPIDRKLNVAITRARKQLILTGNEPTLRQTKSSQNSLIISKKRVDIMQKRHSLNKREFTNKTHVFIFSPLSSP